MQYFGIDFGTTNSANVMIDDYGNTNNFGRNQRPLPSAVSINKVTGEVYTGSDAFSKKIELGDGCEYIHSVKTIIDKDKYYDIYGKLWTPVDIAAEVFKALKNRVAEVGVDENEATVAIPIGFSPIKREKVREAAAKAGIKIKTFISEPTAAFISNYKELKRYSNIAVFDWGGGTLDVSVIMHVNGEITEIATRGMAIAGDAIDERIAKIIHNKVIQDKSVAFEDIPAADRDQLVSIVEQAKCRFTNKNHVETIAVSQYGGYDFDPYDLTFEEFSKIIKPIIDKAIVHFDKAVRDSGQGMSNIDCILMVGGSSNLLPLHDAFIEKYSDDFNEKKYIPKSPEWNVGEGAAVIAKNPAIHYSAQNVGIIMNDGTVYNMLEEGTVIDGWNKVVNFGITDSTGEARFVFTGSHDIDSSDDKYRIMKVSVNGFMQERVVLNASVDQDLVLTIKGRSQFLPEMPNALWKYANLKFYYKL